MDYQDKPVDLNSNVVYEKTNYKNLNRLKEDTLLNNNSSIKSFLLPTDFEKPTDRKRSLSLTSDPTRKFSSGSFTNLSADKQLYSSTSSITSPTRKYSCFSSGEDSEGDESVFLDRSEQRKRKLSSLNQTITEIEKENIAEMIEAIESTFEKLHQRADKMADTLQRVNNKQSKVQVEIKDNISFIKEMKERVKLLLNKQSQIAKNYKNVEQYIASASNLSRSSSYNNFSSPATIPSQQKYTDDYSTDEDYKPSLRTAATTKSTKYDDYDDEEYVPKKRQVEYSDEDIDEVKPATTTVKANGYVDGDDDYDDGYEDSKKNDDKYEDYSEDKYGENDNGNDKNVILENGVSDDVMRGEEDENAQNSPEQEHLDEEEPLSKRQTLADAKSDDDDLDEEEQMKVIAQLKAEHADDDDDFIEELARQKAMEEIRKLQEEDNY